nr:MAG TPA: virion morphogenesis protein [Caudoviricetes sp.]
MSVCTGDWNKLFATLDRLKNVEKEVDDDAKNQAEMLKQAIQNYIINQQGSWLPLSPYTVNKKGNDTILIETGKLVDSVTVDKVGEADYFVHFTGWNTDKSNEQVATENEYGTSTAPPRPFVRPVYEQEGTKAVEGVMDAIKELIE